MEDLGQFRPEVNSPRWFDLQDLPDEVWHDIQEYEGVYQVSCYGRIKSLPRTKNGGSFVHPAKIINSASVIIQNNLMVLTLSTPELMSSLRRL